MASRALADDDKLLISGRNRAACGGSRSALRLETPTGLPKGPQAYAAGVPPAMGTPQLAPALIHGDKLLIRDATRICALSTVAGQRPRIALIMSL
jgi:hypothetical protein